MISLKNTLDNCASNIHVLSQIKQEKLALSIPIIDALMYRQTMDNYRAYVHHYNVRCLANQTTIKYQTELIFSIILGFYASQLRERTFKKHTPEE